ncbi:MAG: alpha/beta hydrolase [Deltaproteobacteria bacterium]|nr:MAG: alpha/beta hydrolase [Deltaproteobacteria bacterium]
MRSRLGKNSQQWIFDYLIRTTGKTACWELDALLERLPVEVKSWDMIHKFLGKKAAREEEFARKAEEAGHLRTAWDAYNRATQSYFLAQHTICEDDNAEKIRLGQKLQECHEKVRKYNEYPIEKVEIPWGDKTVPALFHLLPEGKKAPCVLYVPGMDQSKEVFPNIPGTIVRNPFVERGLHVLAIDGPGQGECNLRKIRVRPDNHKEAGKAAIDFLMTRPEVDGDKIGLYGVSMGTYWGSHITAFDNRIKATVAAMGNFMMDRPAIFEEASPRFRLTYKYMAGIEDEDEFDEMVGKMTLRGIGKQIKNPFLIIAGEFDPLNPLEEADAFFSEIVGPKEMWVMEDDFHSIFARGLCNIPMATVAADWLRDKLDGKYDPNMAKRTLVPLKGMGPYTGNN